jgi:signal transduction histidine kinase
VHQIVINLCTNAYQAMRSSGGRLAVRLRAVEDPDEGQIDPGCYCQLEVSDTGHGMDQAVLAHIFEPFFTTREAGDGTGLGLSVVHGIVASMGGFITVRSAVGQGTTFRVYLPLATGHSSRQGGALNQLA